MYKILINSSSLFSICFIYDIIIVVHNVTVSVTNLSELYHHHNIYYIHKDSADIALYLFIYIDSEVYIYTYWGGKDIEIEVQ